MFDNIGGKIKDLVKILFFLEVLGAILAGVAIMTTNKNMIPIGLLVMIVGPLVAWISSWLIYGYGELIEQTRIIALNTSGEKSAFAVKQESNDERLSKFQKLHSQGLITDEEYQQAISQINRG